MFAEKTTGRSFAEKNIRVYMFALFARERDCLSDAILLTAKHDFHQGSAPNNSGIFATGFGKGAKNLTLSEFYLVGRRHTWNFWHYS